MALQYNDCSFYEVILSDPPSSIVTLDQCGCHLSLLASLDNPFPEKSLDSDSSTTVLTMESHLSDLLHHNMFNGCISSLC